MSAPSYIPHLQTRRAEELKVGDRIALKKLPFRESVLIAPTCLERGLIRLSLQTDSSYQGGVIHTVWLPPSHFVEVDVNWPIRALQLKDNTMTKKTDNHYSPVIIETLLNIHTGVRRDYSHNAVQALQESIKRLLDDELITQVGSGGYATFEPTDRGRAHVTQLLNLPLPVEKKIWANAAGEVIV